jgi:hypothetical protein
MSFEEPEGEFIRRRHVSGTTHATMRTVLDYAEAGVQVTDEPGAAVEAGQVRLRCNPCWVHCAVARR